MKRSMVVCAVFACGVFCVRAGVEVNLAGAWTLTGRDGKGVPIACPIDVPGDTYSALLSAGVIPDPYFGCNETNVQWVGMQDWRIARTFVVGDDVLSAREAVLRIEDCDTFCTVEVNGHRIGKMENRFRRYEFDVKPWLKGGTNTIAGVFESPCRVADERRKGYWRSCPMSNVAPWARNMAFIRKPACHGGWDWGPTLMLEGFCGTVKILASDRPRVEYVYTDQAFAEDLSKCTLTVFAEMSDATVVTNRIEIDDPPLWWPHGYGEQRFYRYSVKAGDETVEGRVGLRKLEVLNERSVSEKGKDELSLTFRVNGRRIFAKGANWIPCDALESRQTEGRYRDLLESAVAANMNMIRLWGGGMYEKDCFYDLCDELGILVWHDMMCSCAVYPAHDEFLDEIRGELAHQLRRLRDHASIALWCGDNECLGAINWFPELDPKIRPRCREEWVRRSKLQGELVAKYDPGRTYWPSSPCAGPGSFADNWKNDAQGDMHNWQVWADNRPFDAYYEFRPRFCSEFGYQSFPSMEVAETFASRSDILARGADFEWHQKNTGGNRKIRETMERYFPPARDVPSELLLSQFQQAMGIKMGVEAWRAQRPRCMGTLFWQLNDNWPVSSWSSIEYGGKWKPLHYLAKQFYEPIRVVAQPDISTGKADVTRGTVYALNDTDEAVDGELTVEYWTYDGQIVSARTKHVTVPPESATEVEAFREPEGRKTFLVMTLRTRCGTCQNDWHFDFYRHVPLADAAVRKEVSSANGRMTIALETDKPAFFVWADVRGRRGTFSENAFTLLPGRPRTIVWKGKDDASNGDPARNLSVTWLSPAAPKIIACWGDSITEGMAMKPAETYPARLQALLGEGFRVLNSGDGGEDAITIPARQGGIDLKTTKKIEFAAGERKVLLGDGNDNGLRTDDGRKIKLTAALGRAIPVNPVRIGNGEFGLSFTDFRWNTAEHPISYKIWLERKDASAALGIPPETPVSFASVSAAENAYCEIFLMGANGGWNNRVEDLIALYRRMIARRGADGAYLVIVPYWAGFSEEQERAFRAAFGRHAIPFRERAIREGLKEEGLLPTERDRAEMASGRVPPSLLYRNRPDVHLNEKGYDFLAKLVFRQGRLLGYW